MLHRFDADQRWSDCAPFLSWSSDSQSLQAISTGSSRRWDRTSGELLAHIESPFSQLPCGYWGNSAASASPNGRLAVASSYDEAARVWDTQTGQHLATLAPLVDGDLIVITPDGHYMSSRKGVEDELVYVVESDTGQQTFTPTEFANKYGWKNDPSRAKLSSNRALGGKEP